MKNVMTNAERIALAIVENAAADCRAAEFCTPESLKPVRSLVKKGILKMVKTGTKCGGYAEYLVTYA